MSQRRATAGFTVAVLLGSAAAVLPGGPAAAAPAPAPAAPRVGTPPADATVTLLTGDRVTVAGGRLSIEPGPGRERIGFSRYTSRGDMYVVPADAVVATAAGRLDRRLFNITQLVRHGYDDRSRAELPLIVLRPGGAAAGQARASQVTPSLPGTTVTRNLPTAGGSAVRTVKADTGRLWSTVRDGLATVPRGTARSARASAAGVQRIMLDGPVRASLDRSVPQIGAPSAWSAGLTGKGVTVAVVDSGIDVTHPDLADAVIASQDFTGSSSGPDDQYGHGTHVASIVTGSGAGHRRGYSGVAPDATLLNAKVLDDDGLGSESTIIAGMEWAATHGAKVVNVSLGMDFNADGTDLMSATVDRLTARTGALFVVAAGNNGPTNGTIGSPAAAESALTVGAVDAEDRLAAFSARGPRYHDDGVKPDITAPGVGIVAALNHGPVEGPYIARSGTSMAAPHVAGAAAILAGKHPSWTAAQLKAVLMGTAVPNTTATVYEQGSGRVHLARAVNQPVHSTTANLNHGVAEYPHHDDVPIVRPVTYVNTGSTPVTLTLAPEVRHQDGRPAPEGMFTVDPARLTVPPGGQAVATVTTDTRVPAPLGVYGGVVTATGPDGIGVRIPVGVDVEQERYEVTVSVRDRTGAPTPQYGFRFTDLDTSAEFAPYAPGGTVAVRLPKGRYRFDSVVRTPNTSSGARNGTDLVIAVEPEVVVDHDQTLTVDGREGRPVALRVERPQARIGSASLSLDTTTGTDTTVAYGWAGETSGFDGVYLRPSRTSAPGRFRFTAEARLAQPSDAGEFRGSPYQYHVRAVTDGRVPDGVSRTFADGDLATVHTTMAAAAPGRTGVRGLVQVPLPGTLTEYYTPGHVWQSDFAQYAGFRREHLLSSLPRTYRKGQVTRQRWNAAVFGPALPHRPGRLYTAERIFDQLSFNIAMFGDAGLDRSGFSSAITAQKTTLHRGDQLVGEYPFAGQGYFAAAPEPAEYRLHSELRQTGSLTSTGVTADWTFTSAPAPAGQVTNLPLLAIRFCPELDDANTAPSAAAFSFGVAVQRNGAGPVRDGVDLTVEVSYDDGATWQPATVAVAGDRWRASVQHPAGPGFVSLRGTARDGSGNSVRQTITRAYALR
jgi:subtilisin family serine protease